MPIAGFEEKKARVVLVAGRYSSRSTGSSRATPSPRRGLSDSTYKGGYGFTRKSFFKNSENNRSHFRNGFATRSDFGHRYDGTSKLRSGSSSTAPRIRPLPRVGKLDIWQPSEGRRLPRTDAVGRVSPGLGPTSPLLTARQIGELLSGRYLLLEVADWRAFEVRFEIDGTLERRRDTNEPIGSWKAAGARLCLEITESRDVKCYRIAKTGPVLTFFLASGAPGGRATFRSGGS